MAGGGGVIGPLGSTSDAVIASAAMVGAIGALCGYYWKVKPRAVRAIRKVTVVVDTLVGSDPIVDPVTLQVLKQSTPGIGMRMHSMEVTLAEMVLTNRRVDAVEAKQAEAERVDLDHQRRITNLEHARSERIAAHLDSAAAWTAVCVEHGQPCDHPDHAAPGV